MEVGVEQTSPSNPELMETCHPSGICMFTLDPNYIPTALSEPTLHRDAVMALFPLSEHSFHHSNTPGVNSGCLQHSPSFRHQWRQMIYFGKPWKECPVDKGEDVPSKSKIQIFIHRAVIIWFRTSCSSLFEAITVIHTISVTYPQMDFCLPSSDFHEQHLILGLKARHKQTAWLYSTNQTDNKFWKNNSKCHVL